QHFAWRQGIGLGVGVALGATAAWLGTARLLAAAPKIFVVALVAAAAVFVPRVGVLAAGARRWVHLGPISGSPSSLLAAAVVLWLAAAESGPAQRFATNATQVIRRRAVAVAGSLLAVLVMALEPDFSAAATTLVVGFATVTAAGRVPARRLIPVAALLLALLAGGALRSAYVDNRIRGFVSPERDPRGKGFEVLALAHANAAAGAGPTGLGRGRSRHRLSSPASDYAFALVGEELGQTGAFAVLACWAAIGIGILWAAHAAARRHDVGGRALAAGLGTALLLPAALHVAVCRGWLPIIGVTMPLLSYDPGLTVVSGAEVGLLAAIATSGTASRPA
ncbi:MAG: FtsW/RodA/SpoVE family cell cycle protein, partial [Pseudomonadota bacterium]